MDDPSLAATVCRSRSTLCRLAAATFGLAALCSPAKGVIIVGTGAGPAAEVRLFSSTGTQTGAFLPYGAFTGGVRVGAADLTGDGVGDIITGTGPGASGGHVKVFDGVTGAELRSFLAFPGFSGGVFVAGGDFNRDGFGDILVGTDGGVTSQVKVFDGQTGTEAASFFAYGGGFTGGVRVGAADVTGDGAADIITGAGPGAAGGHVKVFDGLTGVEIRSFFSYPGFSGGVYVGGGDMNIDGFGDLLSGVDAGAGPQVKAFDGPSGALAASFFAYTAGFAGGVRIGAADITGDGAADIITGAGPGAVGGHVKVFNGVTIVETASFLAFPGFDGGVYVAGFANRVPEPGSGVLVLFGSLGLCARTRRWARLGKDHNREE